MDDKNFDLIVGAKSIARIMNFSERRVRHLADLRKKGESDVPIWNEPGLGIVTSASALREWVRSRLSSAQAK